jgi:hypothetical protein
MSSGNRSTSRGGKGVKLEASTNKPQKADAKTESPKALDHNPKTQVCSELSRNKRSCEYYQLWTKLPN